MPAEGTLTYICRAPVQNLFGCGVGIRMSMVTDLTPAGTTRRRSDVMSGTLLIKLKLELMTSSEVCPWVLTSVSASDTEALGELQSKKDSKPSTSPTAEQAASTAAVSVPPKASTAVATK